jgi:tRNA(adenine34) deaminase
MKTPAEWMKIAYQEAKKAAKQGDVPVGCVIVQDDLLLSKAHNQRHHHQDPLGHAELLAISKASKLLGTWKLSNCELYVTMEPCRMCLEALKQVQIKRVYYGVDNPKVGILDQKQLSIEGGYLEKECQTLVQSFFTHLRTNDEKEESDCCLQPSE